MTTYMSNNGRLVLGSSTIGTVTEMTIEHPHETVYLGDMPMTRPVGQVHATFVSYVDEVFMKEIIERTPDGVQKWSFDTFGDEKQLIIEGYSNNWRIEDDNVLVIELEPYKTYEEQEAEKILNELRARGYMQ